MHCVKSSTSQICFYSILIWTINTQCSHRKIGEIAIRKDFSLKFFHKKVFPWQFNKIKRKFLFAHRLYKNKIILAHRVLDFFSRNAKQEINLTLWHRYQTVFSYFNNSLLLPKPERKFLILSESTFYFGSPYIWTPTAPKG